MIGGVVPAVNAVGVQLVVSLAMPEAQAAQDLRRVSAGCYQMQPVAPGAAMAQTAVQRSGFHD